MKKSNLIYGIYNGDNLIKFVSSEVKVTKFIFKLVNEGNPLVKQSGSTYTFADHKVIRVVTAECE